MYYNSKRIQVIETYHIVFLTVIFVLDNDQIDTHLLYFTIRLL